MQAVLWYMFLFDVKMDKVNFVPANIDAKEAALLKNSASRALAGYKQVK